jgi:hypothetical protein
MAHVSRIRSSVDCPLSNAGSVIVFANSRRPFEQDLSESLEVLFSEIARRHVVDEEVCNTLVKDAAVHGLLTEDKDRQLQTKKNSGFKVIPRSWKILMLTAREGPVLFGPFFPDSRCSIKLMKPENDPAGTVLRDHQNLSEWRIRRIVASS